MKVLSLYKEIGETPLERINRFKKINPSYEGVSMTYAGRLDPMAEGLLLVLTGDEVHKKQEYTDLDKSYEFEVLFGLSTDTLDTLGIINCEKKVSKFEQKQLLDVVDGLLGRQIQRYPLYSSKTIEGQPLWKLAREGNLGGKDIPEHEINIYNMVLISNSKISSKNLIERVLKNISKVEGDFRQEDIARSWLSVLKPGHEYMVLKMKANVSSGTYIRELCSELGKKLDTCALALSIKRLSVGDFKIEE